MKRKAVLIGNTSGLQGVQVDISRFTAFLKSNSGGAWYDNEIDVFQNEKKSALLQRVDSLRREYFDYVVVLFSGHGGQLRETMLEINGNGETIEETSLRSISERQLNAYDCCRSYPVTTTKSLAVEALSSSLRESVSSIRKRYDDRIMQAIPQQALLYSCSIGQVSYDTPNGGVYLSNLLKAAQLFNYDQDFKLVGVAHQEAIPPTTENSLREKYRQVPEAILPKCLSSQQLVISMKA